MDVLVEVAFVAHAEPGVQTSTGIVNARLRGINWGKMMKRIGPRDRVVGIPNIVSKDPCVEQDSDRRTLWIKESNAAADRLYVPACAPPCK